MAGGGVCLISSLAGLCSSLPLPAFFFRGVGVGVGLRLRCEMERPIFLKKSPTELAATGGPTDATARMETKRANLRRARTMAVSCTQSPDRFKTKALRRAFDLAGASFSYSVTSLCDSCGTSTVPSGGRALSRPSLVRHRRECRLNTDDTEVIPPSPRLHAIQKVRGSLLGHPDIAQRQR